MAVTLKEVAKRAGVSRSAVSRTFTAGASVSAKMRRKVEDAAKELGYSPNALASSLTTGRTKLIGLVSNNFHNPFFLQVFDLFTRALQERGLRPLLVNLSDETAPENSVRMLRQYNVDGVVVASSTLPPEFSRAFLSAQVPVVHAFGRAEPQTSVHVVGIDNVQAGRIIARDLIARGYQSVAMLGGPHAATSTQDRHAGFMQELATRPDIKVSSSFAEEYSFEAGRAEMMRLLENRGSTPLAEAYFCGDDVLSIGVLSAIQEAGLDCPADVGLVGLNDMEMAGWQNINLTTLRQPIVDIVASAVELVTEMLETPDLAPQTRVFDCSVVERGTLRPK